MIKLFVQTYNLVTVISFYYYKQMCWKYFQDLMLQFNLKLKEKLNLIKKIDDDNDDDNDDIDFSISQ